MRLGPMSPEEFRRIEKEIAHQSRITPKEYGMYLQERKRKKGRK